MSTRIRISYERDDELQAILKRLSPILSSVKLEPPKGRFKRAYVDVKPIRTETNSLLCSTTHGIIGI